MKIYQTNWNKEELLVYTLIYCANVDFNENIAETNYIKSKIKTSNYDQLKKEFESDSPFDRVQKIKEAYDRNGYNVKDKASFFKDLRVLFLSDGKFSDMEQRLFQSIVNIID